MKIILLIALTLSSLTWGQTMNNREKTEHLFKNLSKDSLHLIEEFYDPNVEFHDPVGEIRGSKKMVKYYENMYKNVKSIRFDFSEFVEQENTIVGVWKMTLITDKLNSGEPVVVDGTSVIKFQNGRAVYHRDYFDMGAFVYENVPVLRFVVKKVKDRFKVEE